MAKVSNGNPKKVCQWYDEGSNHTFREGDIIKVYDEEEPNYGLDEDYRIVKIDLDNEIMESVLLDKNGLCSISVFASGNHCFHNRNCSLSPERRKGSFMFNLKNEINCSLLSVSQFFKPSIVRRVLNIMSSLFL